MILEKLPQALPSVSLADDDLTRGSRTGRNRTTSGEFFIFSDDAAVLIKVWNKQINKMLTEEYDAAHPIVQRYLLLTAAERRWGCGSWNGSNN